MSGGSGSDTGHASVEASANEGVRQGKRIALRVNDVDPMETRA